MCQSFQSCSLSERVCSLGNFASVVGHCSLLYPQFYDIAVQTVRLMFIRLGSHGPAPRKVTPATRRVGIQTRLCKPSDVCTASLFTTSERAATSLHATACNVEQFVRNGLLTRLVVRQRQVSQQFVCIVRCHLHSHDASRMFTGYTVKQGCEQFQA